MLARISRRVIREVRHRLNPPEWERRKRIVDREFDARHGVDTGGSTALNRLDIQSPNRRDGVRHVAVDPQEFASAMAALDLDFPRFTFIDLGSGKGRALLLARDYGFRRIVGVEFSPELVEIAKANLGDSAEVIHADATEYELPAEPTLLFLYNPFGRPVMDKVAARVRASLDANPRDLTVLYLNPFQLDSWLEARFRLIHRGGHFAVLRV